MLEKLGWGRGALRYTMCPSMLVKIAERPTPSEGHRRPGLNQCEPVTTILTQMESLRIWMSWAAIAGCATGFNNRHDASLLLRDPIRAFAGMRIGEASSIKAHRRGIGLLVACDSGRPIITSFERYRRRVCRCSKH